MAGQIATIDDVSFNDQGLVPVIAQDVDNNEILMMAWMNREALLKTLEQGRVIYWSRSRKQFWRKGDTSGHTQHLVSAQLDCDGDTLVMMVKQVGAACHTGERTCFFRSLKKI